MAFTLVVILLWPRSPETSAHPLSLIDPSQVSSVALDGMSLAPGSAAFATAAALPQALATLAPEKNVAWFNTHMIHLTLRDGTALWMQAMARENGVWLRVTADASPRATTAAAARTDAIRALRLLAYKVPDAQIAPMMSVAAVGKSGVATLPGTPTDLSTRTKQD